MKIKRLHMLLVLLALCVCAIPFRAQLRRPVVAVIQIMKGKKTVSDRVVQFGDAVRMRLAPQFASTARSLTLLGVSPSSV
jgi:hypothetical protein